MSGSDASGTRGSGPDATADGERATRLPTARELVDAATEVLAAAGVSSPRHDALALAAHAFGVPRLELVMPPPVTADVVAAMAEAVRRRRAREPLQHILGRTTFRWVTLRVVPGVFVPRPETEVVAGAAIEEAQRLAAAGGTPLVVDLCTGSGAIAAAVAQETPARVVAVDASPEAVELTRENTAGLGAHPVRVEAGDVRDPALLGDLDGAVDVVVSNPPYVPPDAVPQDPEVRDHDPHLALYGGGADGLDVPRAVLRTAARLLRPGGVVVMEHAEVQAAAVRAEVTATGAFTDVHTVPDLTGRERMVVARRVAP